MRKTLLPSSAKPETKDIANTKTSSPADEVADISEILKKRPRVMVEPEPPKPESAEAAPEEKKETSTGSEQTKKPAAAEKPDEDAAEFEPEEKKEKGADLGDMFDPEGMATLLIDIAGFAREWFYPKLYDKYFFTEWELRDLDGTKKKIREAAQKNEEPKLTDYDKLLLNKDKELLTLKLKIKFQDSEKEALAKKLARHIEKIDWMQKLEKYDWILLIFTFEGLRFMELKQTKSKVESR